ncbi:hypothetical protein [Streptomyces sp. NBC_01497]|uniref:hypothetical protein n=1 Tax=Streptomyces sp. NBC_01497 TaxID=2903885 RepID=UPI002E2FD283|nr:hypothetical protein [Streptomyces sp. NBC_01497]
MSDHAAHAHRARELLDASEKWRGGRSPDQLLAHAQVEALLALAAAVAQRRESAGNPVDQLPDGD